MNGISHHTVGHLQTLFRTQKDRRLARRIQGVYLAKTGRTCPEVMAWDQAGFHTAGKLKVPVNVTLVPLPPDSPELKPMENLWHYFRSHYGCNHTYDDYDDLRHASIDAWQNAALNVNIIRTWIN